MDLVSAGLGIRFKFLMRGKEGLRTVVGSGSALEFCSVIVLSGVEMFVEMF